MWMKVQVVRQKYTQLDLRTNFKNYVNSTKFNYLESIRLRVKN